MIYDFFKKQEINGIWNEIGRNCDTQGDCIVKESKIILTIRKDKTLSITSKSESAHFYYSGNLFYRVYTADKKICFSFEVLALYKDIIILKIYDENLQVKDIYAFKKVTGFNNTK